MCRGGGCRIRRPARRGCDPSAGARSGSVGFHDPTWRHRSRAKGAASATRRRTAWATVVPSRPATTTSRSPPLQRSWSRSRRIGGTAAKPVGPGPNSARTAGSGPGPDGDGQVGGRLGEPGRGVPGRAPTGGERLDVAGPQPHQPPEASRSTSGSRSSATSSVTSVCAAATPGWCAPQGSMVRPGAGRRGGRGRVVLGVGGQHHPGPQAGTGDGADTGACRRSPAGGDG